MSDPTYIACPRCGERCAMTVMQKRLFHGRTLTCQRCAKPFTITEETPEPVPVPAAGAAKLPTASESEPDAAESAPQTLPTQKKPEGMRCRSHRAADRGRRGSGGVLPLHGDRAVGASLARDRPPGGV